MRILVVRQHESLVNTFSRRSLSQRVEEGDALPLLVDFDCEVVDKQLSPFQPGERKVEAGDAADNLVADKSCERPKITATQEAFQIWGAEWCRILIEHLRHYQECLLCQLLVRHSQSPYRNIQHLPISIAGLLMPSRAGDPQLPLSIEARLDSLASRETILLPLNAASS